MQTAIEKQYHPHCKQQGCVQLCPPGSSRYEDPATGCVCLISGDYDEERHFTVHTPAEQPVTLVAIDKCLISARNNTVKRCDCAFYTADKIAFVEFKLRAPDREREQDTRAHRRLEKAVEQLATSILRFEQEGLITTETVEAYAHVGYQFPVIAAPAAMLTNLTAVLNTNTQNPVRLFATNEVSF
jgi:hypothetical protein